MSAPPPNTPRRIARLRYRPVTRSDLDECIGMLPPWLDLDADTRQAMPGLWQQLVDEPSVITAVIEDLALPGERIQAWGQSCTWNDALAVLRKLFPQDAYVELNPKDARAQEISQNEWVVVESRRGRVKARAFISHVVQPGQCFMPMHYARTNQLTFAAFDPYSRQPSYKNCAVRVRRRSDVLDME